MQVYAYLYKTKPVRIAQMGTEFCRMQNMRFLEQPTQILIIQVLDEVLST